MGSDDEKIAATLNAAFEKLKAMREPGNPSNEFVIYGIDRGFPFRKVRFIAHKMGMKIKRGEDAR